MLLKTIDRTAIAAWCPSHQHSYLATGTAAGALDASFSNTSNLELYQLDGPVAPSGGDASAAPFAFGDAAPTGSACQPLAALTSAQRFSNLLWSVGIKDRSQGILAGGMENGELIFWDAQRILEQQDADSCVVFRNTNHSGGIAGMDFNNQQKHVLATGASGGEIFIWDLETPAKPYSPGSRSAKLEDITSLAWNNQVTHILASASTTGYTVIWDLKNRREVMSLNYAGNLQMPGMHSMASNRRGVTAVAWNPDNATQLVTATEDDNNPVIMMWDLRNAHAPERIFSGHSKGILSLSWCKMDSDLLFSSGKDNRTICWNPTSGDVVGELPISHNWVFDVRVNQSNPNLLSTASFDSKVNVYSLQSTNEGEEVMNAPANAQDDPFSAAIYSASATASFSLKQPPKWYRRPVGATFGFGNRLVSFAQPPASAQATAASLGTPVAYPVSIHPVVTDRHLIHQTHELEAALDVNHVAEFCDKRIQHATNDVEIKSWQVLKLLFETDARDKLVHFLGYDKEELKAHVAQFLRDHPANAPSSTDASVDPESMRESLGSLNVRPQGDETTPAQDDDEGANPFADGNQEQEGDPDAAFFAQSSAPLTSTDATATTSAAGPTLQSFLSTPLSLHLEDANGPDGLVTRAVLMGDFDHAVDLCLADERFADALILASCGGTDLLARTQQRYFGLKAQNAPYLRLLHGIVSGDLSNAVDHIDIRDWDQVLVLLCTYAQGEQFSSLCDKLGARLEAKWHTQSPGNTNSQLLQSAVVCYLAAGSLDSVVKIWLYLQQAWVQDEVTQGTVDSADNPTIMAESLQQLIEKVSVFRKAVDYIDTAVETPLGSAVQTQTDEPSESSRRKFALSSLYDLYCDYAQWLIAQGQPETAAKFLKRTPEEYFKADFSGDNMVSILKDRLFHSGLASESTLAPSFPFTPEYVGTDGDLGQETASAPAAGHFAATAAPQHSTTAAYGPPSSYQGYPATATSQPAGAHAYANQAPVSHYQTPAPTTAGQPYGGYGASGYDSSYHQAPPAQPGYPATPYQTASASTAYNPYGAADTGASYSTTAPYGSVAPSIPQPTAQLANPYGGYSATSAAPGGEPTEPLPSQQRNIPAYHDPPTATLSRKRNPSGLKQAPITTPFPTSSNTSAPAPPTQASGPPQARLTSPPPPPPSGARPPQRAYRASISKPAGSHTHGGPPPPSSHQGPPPPRPGPPSMTGNPHSQPPPPSAAGHNFPPPPPPSAALAHPPVPTPYPGARSAAPPSTNPYGGHQPPPPTAIPYQQPPRPGPPSQQPRPPMPPTAGPGPHQPPRGPPPGQRPPSAMRGPQPMTAYPPNGSRSQSRPGTPQTAQQSRPGTPGQPATKYPPGDRSHITDHQKPIFMALQGALQQARSVTGPAQKRVLDDTEKRLNQLFDLMNEGNLPNAMEGPLLSLAQALQHRDYPQAHQVYMKMIHTNFDSSQRWMMGVKRLVETLKSTA